MSKSTFHILSTRPLEALQVQQAAEKGIRVQELSFIHTADVIDAATAAEIRSYAAQPIVAVFTSMNAVSALAAQLENEAPVWEVYCLGNTTLKLVQQLFPEAHIAGTGNSAKDLAEKISADAPAQTIVFFCGDQRRDELPAILQQNQLTLKELVVYATTETPVEVKEVFDAILFFSPSAVRSFFSVNQLPEQTLLFCVGTTTAAEVAACCNNKVIVANAPSKEAVLQTAVNYFLHP